MRIRQTVFLLLLVLGLGGYIWFHERNQLSTEEELARIRRAFMLDADRIQRLRIHRPGYMVELRRDGQSWTLGTPRQAPANRAMVKQTLSRLGQLNRGELITPADMRERGLALADFGLAVPQAILTVEDPGGVRTYHIGNPDPLGTSLYVKEEEGQNVMLVSSDLLEILPGDPDVFRDRMILNQDPEDIVGISLITTGRVVRLERKDTGWWIMDPLRTPANQSQVGLLLEKLKQARIEDFVPGDPVDMAPFGLDIPGMAIRTRTRADAVPHEVRIGKVVEGQPNRHYARIPGQGGVFMVSTGIGNLAGIEPGLLRNRLVLMMPSNTVTAITLDRDGRRFRMERSQEDWRLVEPRDAPASKARVHQLLDLWAQARVESYAVAPSHEEAGFRVQFETDPRIPDVPLSFDILPDLSAPGRLALQPVGSGEIWQVLPDTLKYSPVDPLYYRDRSVLSFDPAAVIRISSIQNGTTCTVTRASADSPWTSVVATDTPLTDAIRDVLSQASRIQAASLVAQDPESLDRHGLDQPALRLSIGLGGAQPVNRTLLLGPDNGSKPVTGMIQGQDLVFTLDAALVEKLSLPLCGKLEPEVEAVPHVPPVIPQP